MSKPISSVLILTVHAHPSHYERDIPLAYELRKRGYKTTYAVPGPEFVRRQFPSTNFPADVLARKPFQDVGVVVLKSYTQFRNLLKEHDVLVQQITRERAFEQIATDLGKYRIIHQNTGGADLQNEDPDLVAVAGLWHKKRLLKSGGVSEDRIIVTGSVQYDRALAPEVLASTREAFCAKYKLDPAKPIVVWLPESPATHSDWYKDRYKQICRMVLDSGKFNLIIKGHPSDYAGHKRGETYIDTSRPSWEQLTPQIPVCEDSDGYICFKHCDLGITVTSTVFMDFAIFKKPMIYVDFQEGSLPLGKEGLAKLPPKRFDGFGYRRLYLRPEVMEIMQQSATARAECYMVVSGENPEAFMHFVGAECSLAELPEVLRSGEYRIQDPQVYDEVVRMFCHANDGKSAQRIADLVDRLKKEAKPPHRSSVKSVPWLKRVYRRFKEAALDL